jgi:hypothetical protein
MPSPILEIVLGALVKESSSCLSDVIKDKTAPNGDWQGDSALFVKIWKIVRRHMRMHYVLRRTTILIPTKNICRLFQTTSTQLL